jgi:hypothetical protein
MSIRRRDTGSPQSGHRPSVSAGVRVIWVLGTRRP